MRSKPSLLKAGIIGFERDVGEHHQKAAIGIVSEARVAARGDQSFDGVVVEAQVENGVHHARQRELGAGANGEEQRVFGVAELLADLLFDIGDGGFHFVHQAGGNLLAVGVIFGTDFGGDGEAGRNRQPDIGHFGQVGALAAQQIVQFFLAFTKQPDGFILVLNYSQLGVSSGKFCLQQDSTRGFMRQLNYTSAIHKKLRCAMQEIICDVYWEGAMPHEDEERSRANKTATVLYLPFRALTRFMDATCRSTSAGQSI